MSTLAKVTCLCGNHKTTVKIPSDLPISTATCSCHICRHVSGTLLFMGLPLQGKPSRIAGLESYKSSEDLKRFFCGTCGSQLYILQQEAEAWSVCAGVVDEIVDRTSPAQVVALTQHEFVGSTVDGGLVGCLANYQGKSIPIFLQGPDENPLGSTKLLQSSHPVTIADQGPGMEQPDPSGPIDETMRASCHCGGVQFNITRPTEASKQCSSPWPDLIVPHSAHSENPKDVKWWLCDGDRRYLAGTCACRSCRLASGSPIQTWAFIPKVNIQKLDGSTLDYDLGTLRQYISTQDTYREFCSTCGATVFWHCQERPDLIDVSVGLLRAPEGSRAERWLQWNTERVSFKEHAFDEVLASELERGLRMLSKH